MADAPSLKCNGCGSSLQVRPRDSQPDPSWYVEPCAECAARNKRSGRVATLGALHNSLVPFGMSESDDEKIIPRVVELVTGLRLKAWTGGR